MGDGEEPRRRSWVRLRFRPKQVWLVELVLSSAACLSAMFAVGDGEGEGPRFAVLAVWVGNFFPLMLLWRAEVREDWRQLVPFLVAKPALSVAVAAGVAYLWHQQRGETASSLSEEEVSQAWRKRLGASVCSGVWLACGAAAWLVVLRILVRGRQLRPHPGREKHVQFAETPTVCHHCDSSASNLSQLFKPPDSVAM